jgi:predicted transposase/invertase (TIGR01784 family)
MDHFKDKYINPLTDFGFKKLFGSEPNKILLIDFLNALLPNHKIKELNYHSGERQGLTEIDRKAIFDLYCIGENGEHFIVEMQKAKQNFFKDRSLFYASFPIVEQAKKNTWNYELSAVYSVGILDFVFEEHKDSEEWLHEVQLKDQNCNVFYDKLKFVYIELRKFNKTESELKTRFDKWLYVLKHLAHLQDRPQQLQERIFKRLFEIAEIAKFTPNERKDYQNSLKHYWDLNNVVHTSREEGREEGRQEGREEGRQEGRKAERLEIARNMLREGFTYAQIKALTGLSDRELENL